MKKFEKFLVNQDIYGHPIGVNYRGDGSYKTRLGALCTLTTYALIMMNLTILSTAFFDGSLQ